MPKITVEYDLHEEQLQRALGYVPFDDNWRRAYSEAEEIAVIVRREKQGIAARVAQIKAGWTSKEKAARRVGNGGRVRWQIPVYSVAYVAADPGSPAGRKEKRTKIYVPVSSLALKKKLRKRRTK